MGKTFISFILDESGSMADCRLAAINGFNEYIGELKRNQNGQEMLMSLTKFNTGCSVIYAKTPLVDVKDLDTDTYTPGGMTALYDAIAETVRACEKEVGPDDRALCVILTDGEENSSRETTRQQAFDLIKGKEGAGNWTFTYLGANQDAWAAGAAIGIQAGNVCSYDATPDGTVKAMHRMASATLDYAMSPSRSTHSFYQPIDPVQQNPVPVSQPQPAPTQTAQQILKRKLNKKRRAS